LKGIINRIKQKKALLTNISYYLLASFVGAGIQVVLNPFLALYLEHIDYAIVGYYAAFGTLLGPMIGFSFVSFYTRNYFLLEARERERLKNTLLVGMLIFSSLLSFFAFIGLLIFFRVNEVSIPFLPYVVMSLGSTLFGALYAFLLVEMKLKREAKKFFKYSLIHALIAALFAIGFVILLKWGAFGKMLGVVMNALIFLIITLKLLLRRLEFDRQYFLNALKFCWPLTIAAMFTYFFTGVDRAMLEGLDDVKQLGLYNIAIMIAGYLALFNTALNDTFQPDILESIATRNNKRTLKIIGGIMVLNLIPVFLFIIFAPFILKILTFDRFTDAADFARILSLKNITNGLYFATSSVLIGYGFVKFTLINKIFSTILSLLMFRYLISHFGFYGAAWGQVFSFLILSLFAIIFVFYKLKKTNERYSN